MRWWPPNAACIARVRSATYCMQPTRSLAACATMQVVSSNSSSASANAAQALRSQRGISAVSAATLRASSPDNTQHMHPAWTRVLALQRPVALVSSLGHARQHARCAASGRSLSISSAGSSKAARHKWVCTDCGAEYHQHFGRCNSCQQWGTLEQVVAAPEAPAGSGGAAAAGALLSSSRGGGGSGGSRAARVASSAAGRRSSYGGLGGASAAAEAAAYWDDLGGAAADDDDGGGLGDEVAGPSAAAAARLAALQATRAGGWVRSSSGSSSGSRGAASVAGGPVRLSDLSFEARELRLPLFGATGGEVSRVLGGGVVPGSVVLLGGEPGQGKSTLLLQVAALIAHSCALAAAGGGAAAAGAAAALGAGSSTSDGEDGGDDLPLSQRRAAAAAAAAAVCRSNGSGSVDAAGGWLAEAAAEAAAAAAASSGRLAVPSHCAGRPVLYFTAEESLQQVWERAKRLGLVDGTTHTSAGSGSGGANGAAVSPSSAGLPPPDVRLEMESDVAAIGAAMLEAQPAAVIIDSIQTMQLRDISSRPGTVTQVRECAAYLLTVAKELGCPIFLVGHVNKAGDLAGPKHLEHMVDVVLSLAGGEGGGAGQLRLLRATKNRHGRQGEVGIFQMRSGGMEAVANAAALFAPSAVGGGSSSDSSTQVGTAIAVIQEGGRPLPLEVQCLAVPRLQDVTAAGGGGGASMAAGEGDGYDGYDGYGDDDDGGDDEDSDEGEGAGAHPGSAGSASSSSRGGGGTCSSASGGDEGGAWPSSSSGADDDDVESAPSSALGAGLMRGGGQGAGRQQRRRRTSSSRGYGGGGGDEGGGGATRELLPLFRHPVGIGDRQRLSMLLELMTHYTPIKSHLYNLFINVVAGVQIPRSETLADLPVLASVASSVLGAPLPPGTALMGECGLAGELRVGQHQLQARVSELAKLGFSRVIIPAAAPPIDLSPSDLRGMTVVRAPTLRAALEHCFGAPTLARAGRSRVADKRLRTQQQLGAGGSGGSSSSSSRSSREPTSQAGGLEATSGSDGDGGAPQPRRRSRRLSN